MKLKIEKFANAGYTIVELITVLVILSITAAIAVPSVVGFVGRVKERQYVLEAQSVRRSLSMYLTEHYDYDIDSNAMELLWDMTSLEICSPEHPLADYLTIKCTEGGTITGMTLNSKTREVYGLVYQVAGYRIELEAREVMVTRMDEEQMKDSRQAGTAKGKEEDHGTGSGSVGLADGASFVYQPDLIGFDRIFSEAGSKGSMDLASDSLFCAGFRILLLFDIRAGFP